MGLSHVFPKFEPFSLGSITFFQILEPLDPVFEPSPIPCTDYTSFNAKDYVSKIFYGKLK
jgi:hypothetical protein